MASFFGTTERYIGPANAFLSMLGCNALNELFESIMFNMCTVSEPVSEQFMGALILQLYLLLGALLIFQIYINPHANDGEAKVFPEVNDDEEKEDENKEENQETKLISKKNQEPVEVGPELIVSNINESLISESTEHIDETPKH